MDKFARGGIIFKFDSSEVVLVKECEYIIPAGMLTKFSQQALDSINAKMLD